MGIDLQFRHQQNFKFVWQIYFCIDIIDVLTHQFYVFTHFSAKKVHERKVKFFNQLKRIHECHYIAN